MDDKELCRRTYLDLQRRTGTWKNKCNRIQMRCCVLSLLKWDSGDISRRVMMVTYTDSSSAYSSSDMVQKLWRGEWLSRHWDQWGECPPAGVRLLAPVSFITATSAHPPAAPSLTWPGQGSSSPWFIYTQGEIWWHTHCHFSWEYPQSMYVNCM